MDNDKNHKTEEPKPRLRWSYELHHRFIDAVNQLGGPNSSVSVPFVLLKPYQVWVVRSYFLVSFWFLFCYVVVLEATPKGLMRVLEIPELTLYHLKSHLQVFGQTSIDSNLFFTSVSWDLHTLNWPILVLFLLTLQKYRLGISERFIGNKQDG